MMTRKNDAPNHGSPVAGPFSRMFAVEDIQRDRSATLEFVATEAERHGIAKSLGVVAVHSLVARLDVTRQARSLLKVEGEVKASIEQACVVTLEPFPSDVVEPISIRFAPEAAAGAAPRKVDVAEAVEITMEDDPPDPLINGRVDLGAVCVEFLSLGLDPYPRRPGVAFDLEPIVAEVEDEKEPSPFAALAGLKIPPSKL